MLLYSVLSGLTDAVTSAIGDYGLYAVFLLMLVDAVFPARERGGDGVRGRRRLGCVRGAERRLPRPADRGRCAAYLAMAVAGTVGYTVGSVPRLVR